MTCIQFFSEALCNCFEESGLTQKKVSIRWVSDTAPENINNSLSQIPRVILYCFFTQCYFTNILDEVAHFVALFSTVECGQDTNSFGSYHMIEPLDIDVGESFRAAD